MKLRRITINGEYNLKNVDLDLKNECALLVGANGCGKTNILKCIAAVLKAATVTDDNGMIVELTSGDMRLKEPSIKLYFDLNKNERKEIMELRTMYVIDKTIQLCKSLVEEGPRATYISYRSSPEVTKFRQKVIPQLLDVFKASCKRLGEWHKSSDNADVIISYHDTDRGVKKTSLNLTKTDLLEQNMKESKIISTCMQEVFGDQVLSKTLSLRRNSAEETENLSHIIEAILKNNSFLTLTSKRESNFESDYLGGRVGSRDLEELETFFGYRSDEYLNEVIKGFLKRGSAYILPQHRGRIKAEEEDYYWTLEKAEEKIIKAYLSKEGSKECAYLNKVKEALLCIGGLDLDVAYDESKPSVFLQEFGKKQAEWRKISNYSGGQQELVMVLSAIHLSEGDNVLLDEPGHFLHPPKQAQLRRWLEEKREPDQVLFTITHSSDMISPTWLESLYHMHPDGDDYTASCLRKKPRNEARKIKIDVSPSPTAHSSASCSNEEDVTAVGSKRRLPEMSDAHQESVSKKKRVVHKFELDPVMIDFLMKGEMRRLFFSSGVVFVEGDSDRRIIEALKSVELDKLKEIKEDQNTTLLQWYDAYTTSQMDHWDIIPIDGCKNWLKAYTAASSLKIPFVVVLDADVLNKTYDDKICAITNGSWSQSTLAKLVKKSKYDDEHPLRKMCKEVDGELDKKQSNPIERAREVIKKYNLWVWSVGNLEDLFFKDKETQDALLKNELFIKAMEKLEVGLPGPSTSKQKQSSEARSMEDVKKICTEFQTEMNEQCVKLIQAAESLNFGFFTSFVNTKPLNGIVGELIQNVRPYAKQSAMKEDKETNQTYWEMVKNKLHNQGKWKIISFQLLKDIVKTAIQKKDHELHLLWKHIKTRFINGDTKARFPPAKLLPVQDKALSVLM